MVEDFNLQNQRCSFKNVVGVWAQVFFSEWNPVELCLWWDASFSDRIHGVFQSVKKMHWWVLSMWTFSLISNCNMHSPSLMILIVTISNPTLAIPISPFFFVCILLCTHNYFSLSSSFFSSTISSGKNMIIPW